MSIVILTDSIEFSKQLERTLKKFYVPILK